MNLTQLPTTPELPSQRYDEIRAELLSSLDRPRRPARRRWPAPAAVGVATAVVIGVVVATGIWSDDPPDRKPVGDGSSLHPPVFDEPDGNRDRFEARCREGIARMRTQPGVLSPPTESDGPEPPGIAPDFPAADRFRIYNYVNHPESGELALLYSDNGYYMPCGALDLSLDAISLNLRTNPTGRWLAGHVTPSGSNPHVGPHHVMLVGRTSAKVTRVTISVGTDTAEAHIANHTFIGVIGHPESVDPDNVVVTIRGYDASGNLITEWQWGGKPTSEECWITPDGTRLSGDDDIPANECRPAPEWPTVE